MENSRLRTKITRLIQIFCICGLVFASAPSFATYYGNPYYKHQYGYYAYPHHRPFYRPYYHPYYNYHHGRHAGYRAHYGVHAHINETAAYVVLGVLGAALLTHIFTNNESQYSHSSTKTYPPVTPVRVIKSPVVYNNPIKKTVYKYDEKEGWERLADGDFDFALDIFAIQSQQNLNSGNPKIGFALSAAAMGEKSRAMRAMRKAMRIDANALNSIDINTIKPTLEKLGDDYQSIINNNSVDSDIAFMTAALTYLQQDYETAKSYIDENDYKPSTINLRELLKNKL